jgi:hypothetical protein
VNTRLAICLGLAAALVAALPSPASAQALLPPYEITTSVRSMGLDPISEPVRRGARYVLRAIDGRGAEVKVAADALNGRILSVKPVRYGGPVYAERSYPPGYYPDETAPPRGGYERQGSYDPPRSYERRGNYDQKGSYDQQGSHERQPQLYPGEPSVIYAPRENATAQPPVRAPSAGKPLGPNVASKPPTKPAAPPAKQEPPVEASAPEQTAADTSGATPSSPPPEKNPALVAPPVQAFD